MAAKQPNVFQIATASDQITVLSVGLPAFAVAVQRAVPDTSGAFNSMQGPSLLPAVEGNVWVVNEIASPLGAARLWQLLLDPHTFGS
jgi:hypothetical protein